MSRPTKLTDDLRERIAQQVAEGIPTETAARLAGIAPSTVNNWLARGRDELARREEAGDDTVDADYESMTVLQLRAHAKTLGVPVPRNGRKADLIAALPATTNNEQPFVEFLVAVTRARAAREAYLVRLLGEQAASDPKHWQATKWLLQNINPDVYRDQPSRTELTGAQGGPVQVESVSPAELVALADELTGAPVNPVDADDE